ncbi:MAG TPA: hypothetical protein VNS55_14470 [Nocardioides sp.]|nr:hypothetical protein [Nocardioides sp.]
MTTNENWTVVPPQSLADVIDDDLHGREAPEALQQAEQQAQQAAEEQAEQPAETTADQPAHASGGGT